MVTAGDSRKSLQVTVIKVMEMSIPRAIPFSNYLVRIYLSLFILQLQEQPNRCHGSSTVDFIGPSIGRIRC